MAEPPPALAHLICGSTGAGKTTYARQLAERIGGVRFSIDDWMTTLFWKDSTQPIQFDWAIERVGRCEAQMLQTARQLAALGIAPVLDLGLSRAEHRARIAAQADQMGLGIQLHYLDVAPDERWRRVTARNGRKGETFAFEVTREMFDFVEGIWEPPSAQELARLNGVRIAQSLSSSPKSGA